MPLIRHENHDIIVPISDKIAGTTRIKRKAKFLSMIYDIENTKVFIKVRVIPFADNQGEYGEDLSGSLGFTTVDINQVADYSMLVDLNTGNLIPAELLGDENNWNEGMPLYGKNVMYEFEYYKQVASTNQVIIDELIVKTIKGADLRGRFV